MERDDGSAVEILHGRGRIDLGQTRLRLFGGHRRIHRGVGDDQAVRTVRGSGGKDIALGDLLVIQLNRLPVGRDIELEALSLNQLAFGGQVGQRGLLGGGIRLGNTLGHRGGAEAQGQHGQQHRKHLFHGKNHPFVDLSIIF